MENYADLAKEDIKYKYGLYKSEEALWDYSLIKVKIFSGRLSTQSQDMIEAIRSFYTKHPEEMYKWCTTVDEMLEEIGYDWLGYW